MKLSQICTLKQWKTISKNQLVNDGYPVYGANGIIGYSNEFNHETPTLMIGCRGTCGEIHLSEGKAYINGNAMCLDNLSSEFDINYVKYFLEHYDFSKIITGTAQPQITQQGLDKVQISKIPLEEQKLIASKITNIKELTSIETNAIRNLDGLIKSRFNELFSSCNFTKEKLDSLTIKITDGSHNPPKGISKSNYIMASSQNIFDTLDLANVRYLSKEDFIIENKRTNIQEGDLLFTIVGTIGRSYVVKDEKMVFQRSVAVIKPKHNLINSIYLKYFLSSQDGMDQINKMAHGVAQKGIYLSDLKKIVIKVPDIDKQNIFESFVSLVDKLKFNLLLSNQF